MTNIFAPKGEGVSGCRFGSEMRVIHVLTYLFLCVQWDEIAFNGLKGTAKSFFFQLVRHGKVISSSFDIPVALSVVWRVEEMQMNTHGAMYTVHTRD